MHCPSSLTIGFLILIRYDTASVVLVFVLNLILGCDIKSDTLPVISRGIFGCPYRPTVIAGDAVYARLDGSFLGLQPPGLLPYRGYARRGCRYSVGIPAPFNLLFFRHHFHQCPVAENCCLVGFPARPRWKLYAVASLCVPS